MSKKKPRPGETPEPLPEPKSADVAHAFQEAKRISTQITLALLPLHEARSKYRLGHLTEFSQSELFDAAKISVAKGELARFVSNVTKIVDTFLISLYIKLSRDLDTDESEVLATTLAGLFDNDNVRKIADRCRPVLQSKPTIGALLQLPPALRTEFVGQELRFLLQGSSTRFERLTRAQDPVAFAESSLQPREQIIDERAVRPDDELGSPRQLTRAQAIQVLIAFGMHPSTAEELAGLSDNDKIYADALATALTNQPETVANHRLNFLRGLNLGRTAVMLAVLDRLDNNAQTRARELIAEIPGANVNVLAVHLVGSKTSNLLGSSLVLQLFEDAVAQPPDTFRALCKAAAVAHEQETFYLARRLVYRDPSFGEWLVAQRQAARHTLWAEVEESGDAPTPQHIEAFRRITKNVTNGAARGAIGNLVNELPLDRLRIATDLVPLETRGKVTFDVRSLREALAEIQEIPQEALSKIPSPLPGVTLEAKLEALDHYLA